MSFLGTDKWDLIGSPVSGQSINSFVTANSSTLATNGATKAVGYYDNADNTWTNYTTSTIGGSYLQKDTRWPQIMEQQWPLQVR